MNQIANKFRVVPSPFKEGWSIFKRSILSNIGLISLSIILMITLFGPWIAPFNHSTQNVDAYLVPPSWYENGRQIFFVGTDGLGRDLFSRILFGARLTIGSAFIAVLMAMLLGVSLGGLAATSHKIVNVAILRTMDVLLALPSLLLAILLIISFGSGLVQATLAVTITLIPHFVRITHDLIREEMSRDYVKAAELDGANVVQLVINSILPNIIERLAIHTTLSLSTAILDIAALGFLGFGAMPSSPEWGTLLSESLDYIQIAPWTVTLPGIAIFITVLSINLVGEGLRTALDPKQY